jgi:hypothetical protein
MMADNFDASRAQLGKADIFDRFRVPNNNDSLSESGLSMDASVMVVKRSGEALAFLLHQLAYHHLAQGLLAGEPYMVSF